MIKDYKFDANCIYVAEEKGCLSFLWEPTIKAIINNDNQILVHSCEGELERVDMLDSEGQIKATIKSNSDFCILYLSKHPQFGLCAVCSERQIDQSWKDGYYAHDGDRSFVRMTNFR